MSAPAERGTALEPVLLTWYMPNTPKQDPRPLFTPSTLPKLGAPDPVVAFIEDALLTIANRQAEVEIPDLRQVEAETPELRRDEAEIPEPSA
jgi:hypothetical protein